MKRKHLYGKLDPKKIARSLEKEVPTWELIWKACWAKVRARRPRIWSSAAWREMMLAEAYAATFVALRDFDRHQRLTLGGYVALCMQNAMLQLSQRERSYARRVELGASADSTPARDVSDSESAQETVSRLLGQLPADEILLAQEIFLSGKTEQVLAGELKKSQSWVSKQKSRLLGKLRQIAKKDGGGSKILEYFEGVDGLLLIGGHHIA